MLLYKLQKDNLKISSKASIEQLHSFVQKTNLLLPQDISEYFEKINGTDGDYDDNLFTFYNLLDFKNIKDGLFTWSGSPDYSGLIDTLDNNADIFIFADHSFKMFTYAIRLYPIISDKNEVFILCGNEYRVIANSFTEFIDLYLNDDISLYFE